jgi:DNA (cytosine-5)-methyltransferase 1
MSLGIERAGFDIVLGVDYDGYHVAAHERNFPYGRSICSVVEELHADGIFKLLDPSIREIDLIFGGPPCQGFSNMGLRDAQDPRNSLIFHFARIIREIRPKAFVMENVTGLNMGATSALFETFIKETSADFNVTLPVRVLNAMDFGVPQARKRLFVLGIRKDVGQAASYPGFPSTTPPTVLEAIGDLPRVELYDDLFSSDSAPSSGFDENSLSEYARRARGLEPIPNDFGHERIWDSSLISGCMRTRHTPEAIRLYASTEQGSVVPGHKLPRLKSSGHCPTLRAGANSERGSHTAPRPVHPLHARVITAREAARLHGYPDWFSFYPSKLHAYRQIGNSVCPPVAHAVGLQIMQSLGLDPSELVRRQISLGNSFELPANSPSQHSRIPVRVEYPKIINYLWERAFDPKTRTLLKPHFDADDIRAAICATGANLPRVRPERFLYEASQQRAIRDILSAPLSLGYSIAIAEKDTGRGLFQPAHLPNSLGRAKAITIKSGDLKSATFLSTDQKSLDSDGALVQLIEQPVFASKLSDGQWLRLRIARDLLGEPSTRPMRATLETEGEKPSALSVEVYESPSVTHEQVMKFLKNAETKQMLILMKLTKNHFAGCYVELVSDFVVERFKRVFCVNNN